MPPLDLPTPAWHTFGKPLFKCLSTSPLESQRSSENIFTKSKMGRLSWSSSSRGRRSSGGWCWPIYQSRWDHKRGSTSAWLLLALLDTTSWGPLLVTRGPKPPANNCAPRCRSHHPEPYWSTGVPSRSEQLGGDCVCNMLGASKVAALWSEPTDNAVHAAGHLAHYSVLSILHILLQDESSTGTWEALFSKKKVKRKHCQRHYGPRRRLLWPVILVW